MNEYPFESMPTRVDRVLPCQRRPEVPEWEKTTAAAVVAAVHASQLLLGEETVEDLANKPPRS